MGLCAIVIVLSVCLRHIMYFIYSCRAHVALKFFVYFGILLVYICIKRLPFIFHFIRPSLQFLHCSPSIVRFIELYQSCHSGAILCNSELIRDFAIFAIL